jgi:hypothetical protein
MGCGETRTPERSYKVKKRIHVTQEDIDTTLQGQPEACMVWRAVCRNLQLEAETGAARVTVNVLHDSISFEGHGKKAGRIVVPNSSRTTSNIKAFDKDKSLVKPFSFNLDLPDDWREQVTGLNR